MIVNPYRQLQIQQPAPTFRERMQQTQARCDSCDELAEAFWSRDGYDLLLCGGCYEAEIEKVQKEMRGAPEPILEPLRAFYRRHGAYLLATGVILSLAWFGQKWVPAIVEWWQR